MSDKGYSSMTLDDSKRTSLIISSEDSIDSLEKGKSVGSAAGGIVNNVEMRNRKHNIHRRPAGKISSNPT